MRKHLRRIAKANMERLGVKRINRKFAHLWRNYIGG